MERSSVAVRTACDIQIDGRHGGREAQANMEELMDKDCREWKLTTVDPQERSTCRSVMRSAMIAASQLPERGPTDVDSAPAR